MMRTARNSLQHVETRLVRSGATRNGDGDEYAWRDGAACRDSDPDLFFPIGSTGMALETIAAAKAVCRACAVREQCLEFALQTNQEAGIWGGTSEDERRKLRRAWVARRRGAVALR